MKILFGVFDWGLGHATRDIPLITALLQEHEVHILSTGRGLTLLQAHFGERCTYYDVPSVRPPTWASLSTRRLSCSRMALCSSRFHMFAE